MPTFSVDDLDISVDEFLDQCSDKDIQKLIKILVEDDNISLSSMFVKPNRRSYSKLQIEFVDKIQRLITNYHRISIEDEQKLDEIFKKYF